MGFAVPIFSHKKVIASLSVFLPEFRSTHEKQQEIIEALQNAVKRIEKEYIIVENFRLSNTNENRASLK